MISVLSSRGMSRVVLGFAAAALLGLAAGCSSESVPGAAVLVEASREDTGPSEVTLDQVQVSTRQAAEMIAAQAGLVLVNPGALPGDDVYLNPLRAMPARAAMASVAASAGTGVAFGEDGQVRFGGSTTTLEAWQDEHRRPQFAVHADQVDGWQVLELAARRSGKALVQSDAVVTEPRPVVLNFYRIPAQTLYSILSEELGVSITMQGDAVMVSESAASVTAR